MAEYAIVSEYEDYMASSEGDIISLKTKKKLTGGLKPTGYREVILFKDGTQKSLLVHRIIAQIFCEKKEGATEVNHINGNKDDNRACNLEWVTHEDNLKHAYETGLMPNDATPKAVVATNMETGEQMLFPSIYKAARFFGISQGNICSCCKKARPYANGYYWDYLTQEGEE